MIYNRLLTIADVADYLQMSESFVLREIHLDNLEAVYIGYNWRIEASAVVAYIETRKTLTPLLSGRRFRVVE
jgi:excisionase family DNA binding protein